MNHKKQKRKLIEKYLKKKEEAQFPHLKVFKTNI